MKNPALISIYLVLLIIAAFPNISLADQATFARVSRHIATIEGDWKERETEAWKDVKKKALEKALNAYKITGQTVTKKGSKVKITIIIEWAD